MICACPADVSIWNSKVEQHAISLGSSLDIVAVQFSQSSFFSFIVCLLCSAVTVNMIHNHEDLV